MSSSPALRVYTFEQVDVFTDRVFGGNPLAVVLDGRGLSDAEMQAIAGEMNLSETTFVLPPTRPDCCVRLRIFTPTSELPFAGHPTVGTTFVLASRGLLPLGQRQLSLEEAIGPVPVRLEGDLRQPTFIWMGHQDATFVGPWADREGVARALRVDATDLLSDKPLVVGSTGVPFLYVPLRDTLAVDRVILDRAALEQATAGLTFSGVFVLAPAGEGRVYSRVFAPALGIPEDPATGGATGALGAYVLRYGIVPGSGRVRLVSEQGTKMGRQSFLHVQFRADGPIARDIEVGGSVVPVLDGQLRLP